MNVLIIGDPHFKKNNIKECTLFKDKILKCVTKFKPNFVVILGDLLDKHNVYHEAPFNLAINWLSELSDRVKTFLLIGNHELANNNEFLSERHPFNALKKWGDNMVIVDKPISYTLDGMDFVFVPYVPPGRFLESLKEILFETADCIFAHQEFYGCKMGAIESTMGDKWDSSYPFVISGHIHNQQFIEPNIWYVGTPMQHSFGDSDSKRVWLIDFKSQGTKFPFKTQGINLKLPVKKIYYYDNLENINEFNPPKNQKSKIILKCSQNDYKAFIETPNYQKLIQEGVKIVFKTEKEISEQVLEKREIVKKSKGGYTQIFNNLIKNEKNNDLEIVYKELKNE